MVDQPDKRAAYNDSAARISANQIPDRPLLAQSCRSRAFPFLRCRVNGVRKQALNLSAGVQIARSHGSSPKASAKSFA